MSAEITYRPIEDLEGFAQVSELEMFIWGLTGQEAISVHIQRILTHTGGGIIGAYDGEELVGFAVGLATHDPEKLWSHMAGVHPDYQRRGIGYQLKMQQREWARQQGYRHIHWTFDPVMSQNAHFNLRLLHARVSTYHVNFYGEMSGINAGLPTDRLEASWPVDESTELVIPNTVPYFPSEQDDLIADWYALEIPADFLALKQENFEQALATRLGLRAALQRAFAAGYTAVDFVREGERCWYVLSHKSS